MCNFTSLEDNMKAEVVDSVSRQDNLDTILPTARRRCDFIAIQDALRSRQDAKIGPATWFHALV